jgi:hypothetical protein
LSGKTSDGIFLSGAIIFNRRNIMYKNARSRNSLDKLKVYKPNAKSLEAP